MSPAPDPNNVRPNNVHPNNLHPNNVHPNNARNGRVLRPFRCPGCWVGLWCLGIVAVIYFSLAPPGDLPGTSLMSDKLSHFLAYACLAAGAVQLLARRRAQFGAGVGLLLLGVLLECLQQLTGLGRTMDLRDALANTLGVMVGLATMVTPLRELLSRLDSK